MTHPWVCHKPAAGFCLAVWLSVWCQVVCCLDLDALCFAVSESAEVGPPSIPSGPGCSSYCLIPVPYCRFELRVLSTASYVRSMRVALYRTQVPSYALVYGPVYRTVTNFGKNSETWRPAAAPYQDWRGRTGRDQRGGRCCGRPPQSSASSAPSHA